MKAKGPALNAEPPTDYNFALGTPLNIPVPSEATSPERIEITALPTNGTVVLSAGSTPVIVGESLTPAQAAGLRFRPNGVATSSSLTYDEVVPGNSPTHWSIGLLFDPKTNTITPAAAASVTEQPLTASGDPPADPDVPIDVVTSAAMATLAAASTTNSPAATASVASSSEVVSASIAAAENSTSASAVALGAAVAVNAITATDYNAVFGKALNIWVQSEAPSPETFQITALPTNGTVTLSDGTTPVVVGRSLTPAQAAGLRFKPNGVASSSQLNIDQIFPGKPTTHRSISLSFDPKTSHVTLAEQNLTAVPPKAGSTSTTTPVDSASATPAANNSATPANPNPIVLENEKPGTPESVWQIDPGGDSTQIQGFTTSISTSVGNTVQFKINNQTGNGTYQIQIYRLGYYGGDGATLVTTLNHSGSPVVQPSALTDPSTGLVDAGNWSVTDSWAVPSTATSGVYVANVIDGSQVFQIPLVITNPSSTSDIVFQTSDETWQAYNGWGGNNLYGGSGPSTGTPGAAFAVSYNRPIVTRDSVGTYAGPQDSLFGSEYAAINWLEQNGYNVSYISGIDTATNGSLLLNHKVFMDDGHDEYWTDAQVDNVEAANNAGVSLAFLSGNEVFWQTRLSTSLDSSAAPNRTLVSYKDTHSDEEIDPSGKATGTFEDPRFGTDPEPSNEVTGTLFQVDQTNVNAAITIPYGETNLRFWRNTSVAQTASGQTASLEPNLLGYEWDSSPDNGFAPAGLIDLSSTTVQEDTEYNTDWGSVDTSGTATNNLVEYRDPTSGALVFGAGTVFWSWGLSNEHDNSPSPFSSSTTDPSVQQGTVNLLADMGVQPQTLQASLAIANQSTDTTAPTSAVSTVSSKNVVEGQTVTVTGTATDVGGVLGGVQVSADGGVTWHPASGQVGAATMNWSYSFATAAPGTYTIQSRAVDDSLNLEKPAAGVSYTVTPSTALSLFSADTTPPIGGDASAIEVGVKFTAATSGLISGIRFYKGSANTGTHVGDLWSASGTLLASATFTNETASGWQQVNFSTPVSITAATTYIASYHTNTGDYADTPYFFATYQGQSNGSLNAPGDSLNGVYAYGTGTAFPSATSLTADNYWVDVVFNDSGRLPPVLGNVAATASYNAGGAATTLSSGTSVSDSQSATLASGSVSISNGLLAGDTLAAVTTGTSIVASYSGSTGVLSLTGSDTLAHYQQVLDSVSYSSSSQNPNNFGADANRTVSWVVNDGAVNSPTQATTVSVTGGPATASLFSQTATPTNITENDSSAVDLGVKFQASTGGTLRAIRFYKGPQNTGTHTGDLWSTSGTLLASATFSNETASGWQQVNFSTPVNIAAGTTYIASYETTVGEYSADLNYFANAVTSGPLTALSSSSSGGNGVYAYGSSNPFPNNTYNATNYWVDVVFTPSAALTFTSPASITGTAQEGSVLTAVNGTTNDPNAVISGYQWQSSSDGGTTWANVTNAAAQTYTPVEADETHLLRVVETATDSGTSQSSTSASAATAAVADIVLAFTSAASTSGAAAVGAVLTAVKGGLNDADAAVTGYQWQSSSDNGATWPSVSGATGSTYTPVAADQGHLLRVVETATDADGGPSVTSNSPATAAVANNSLTFGTPASITGMAQEGSVLTAVKGAPNDPNAVISGYQWQSSSDGGTTWANVTNAAAQTYTPVEADETHLLRVVETATDSGTSQSGTSASAATAAVADIVLAFTSAASTSGAAAVGAVLTAVKGGLNDADAAVTGYQWQSSSDNGATWPSVSGATASTYTPVAADQGHLLRVVETATDADGGPSVTSNSPATAAVSISLFPANPTPNNITENDPSAVDLGVKFQASTGGKLSAIRFYKGPQNTGTHTGDLWSTSGTLLASATFSNETASGWQQVNFSTPVNIAAGTTYIASYETTSGKYSEDDNYFTNSVTSGPLTALSSSSSGGNGVYAYGSSNPFPNNTYNAANYWVDVVFTPSAALTFKSSASITGTAQEGSVLTAVKGAPNDPNAVISGYQWQSSSDGGTTWANVTNAAAQTYTPVEADETHLLRVVETATDSGTSQSGTSASAATAAVADIVLAFTSAASTSGAAAVGAVLTAVKGGLNDADAAVTGYQWQSSSDNGATWPSVSGATASTYTPVAADQGHLLRVVETATDADGGPSVTSNSPATAAVAKAPTGFTFAPATSSLQALQSGGANLAASTPIGTLTEVGGVAGDSYTYTLSGSTALALNASANISTLSTGSGAVAGGTKAALSIGVNDTTDGGKSGPLPFEIVLGSSSADTINLNTLGIAASTPTMVYGLAAKDTLNASGMSGQMWFIGGAGVDTLTGGTGPNTYLYAAATNSMPAGFDIITNFKSALDKIDLTGLGPTALSFLPNQISSTIAAQSIGWQQSGGNTFVYANTTTAAESLSAANMEIQLSGTITVASSNVLHS